MTSSSAISSRVEQPGTARGGFTLIEMSIVLVIIGLIVGAVLVGQDLIKAAQVRATITQIEKYNTAANTFFGKYGYLPGDIPAGPATQFGFAARGQYAGEGDGNGIIEGVTTNAAGNNWGTQEVMGETVMFWVDLSQASLIENTFTVGSPNVLPTSLPLTGNGIGTLLPPARLGQGNFFYVWSGGFAGGNGLNYFGLSGITSLSNSSGLVATTNLTVQQAYSIDNKIDDGLPQSGNVLAQYFNQPNIRWAAGGGNLGIWPNNNAAASSTSCYDNAGSRFNPMQYSLGQSSGNGVNCALSFKMQAGDQ